MRRLLVAGVLIVILVALGCVRIPSKFEAHITIDIRHHVEEQAASTLDFIEGKTDKLPPPRPAEKASGTSWLWNAWDTLSMCPTAYAASLNTSSETITKLASKMRDRNAVIQPLKTTGVVGEDNRGYLSLRAGEKKLNAEARNEAQRVIAAENKDRKELYTEVVRLNKDQDISVSDVERIYANERLKRGKSGEWVQLPDKGAEFESFRSSEAGNRLGAECKPGNWVTLK